MADNKEMVIIHRHMHVSSPQEPVDILLTPQFYVLKKEKLPIRFSYQARGIAPSMFDGMLEAEREYEYFVFKQGEMWVFIAYCLDEVMTFLEAKGIGPDKLSNLYFAEQYTDRFETPYLLSEKEVLGVIDGTVALLPRTVVSDALFPRSFEATPKPKERISIGTVHTSLLSLKQTAGFAAVFLLFALLFVIEGAHYSSQSSSSEAYEALIKAHPTLKSEYARESVASKYKKIDKEERQKREAIKKLAAMHIKGVTFKQLKLDAATFQAELSIKEKRIYQQVERMAKKEKLTASKVPGGILIKGTL